MPYNCSAAPATPPTTRSSGLCARRQIRRCKGTNQIELSDGAGATAPIRDLSRAVGPARQADDAGFGPTSVYRAVEMKNMPMTCRSAAATAVARSDGRSSRAHLNGIVYDAQLVGFGGNRRIRRYGAPGGDC